MRLGHWLGGLALGLAATTGIAWACADPGCSVSWKLAAQDMDCASRAILSPANDTRVNLLMLLRDQAGLDFAGLKSPQQDYEWTNGGDTFYSWRQLNMALFPGRYEYFGGFAGEAAGRAGSRCVSLSGGSEAFGAALAANRALPAAERSALLAARQRLVAACDAEQAGTAVPWPAVDSAPGKSFLAYLQAGEAFYRDDWDTALAGFAALRSDADPWLKETAAYMVARVKLNTAQARAVDEYGWFKGPKGVDQAAARAAGEGFSAYLKTWPNGRYAASAQGLLRRVAWLSGDSAALARSYAAMLGKVERGGEAATLLVEEIDNKLIADPHQKAAVAEGPLLLATINLMRMRPSYDGNGEGPPPLSAAELEAQAPQFAGQQALFDHLRATHAFYVAKDYKRVVQLLPDDARQTRHSNLGFSRQVLRGMALAALKDRNEAGFWQELMGGAKSQWQRTTAELGLALNWERAGKIDAVFAAGSPVRDSAIRRILLTWSAPAPLLRKVVQDRANPAAERDAALYTLLANQLTRGEFAGFVQDVRIAPTAADAEAKLFSQGKVSDGYPCAPISITAAALAKAPQDIPGRLCLGDFYRLHGLDSLGGEFDPPPKADELGGSVRGFTAPRMYRSAFYTSIIANPRAGANDKAYALYRAVMCYAPSGMNDCGGPDAPAAQRKAWFQQLKRDYPASAWAKKLRFYW